MWVGLHSSRNVLMVGIAISLKNDDTNEKIARWFFLYWRMRQALGWFYFVSSRRSVDGWIIQVALIAKYPVLSIPAYELCNMIYHTSNFYNESTANSIHFFCASFFNSQVSIVYNCMHGFLHTTCMAPS